MCVDVPLLHGVNSVVLCHMLYCVCVCVVVVVVGGKSFPFTLIAKNQGRGAYCSLHHPTPYMLGKRRCAHPFDARQ
jgi:hypothetical protein